ncbi:MAG: hypothetical protein N2589_07405 [bacterium]|nr:hypothetical protein [bacterium]MCX7917928.1 hypothetical protein [bacterium]MDW8163288.1 hypothetical protein [Candidatus Omnitrophota bacterium]
MGKTIKILHFLLILLLFFGCDKEEKIIKLPLTQKEIEEAIEYGKKNASLTFTEFTENWTVGYEYEYGKGKAVLITPFLRVALLSKNAVEKRQKLNMKIVNYALKEVADKIFFKVSLYGNYATFGRTAKFYLEYNGKKIQPISFYMSPYSQFTRDYYHISEGEVKFLNKDIPPNAKIKLVAIFKPYEDEEEKCCSFEFDLSKFK